jgi:DNA-binding transcriptional LysR family regulator
MDTFTGMNVFRQVVESGSFVAAAERLDVSTATVSKNVMHVEKRLGVRLLNRNSRKLSLTEPGRLYFERCKTILEDLQATEAELGSLGSRPRGTLRITAPSFAEGHLLADLLAEYRHRFPEILVDASFEDRFVDLVEEGYDLALRIAPTRACLPSGLVARPIRAETFYLAASREYLERNGTPQTPEDLVRHDFVAAGNLNSLPLASPKGASDTPLKVVLRYRSIGGVANAIVAGMGIGTVPAMVLEQPPFNGLLTPILLEYPLTRATLYLVYVSRKFIMPKIRTFVDFAVESLAAIPEPKVVNQAVRWPLASVGDRRSQARSSNATVP